MLSQDRRACAAHACKVRRGIQRRGAGLAAKTPKPSHAKSSSRRVRDRANWCSISRSAWYNNSAPSRYTQSALPESQGSVLASTADVSVVRADIPAEQAVCLVLRHRGVDIYTNWSEWKGQ